MENVSIFFASYFFSSSLWCIEHCVVSGKLNSEHYDGVFSGTDNILWAWMNEQKKTTFIKLDYDLFEYGFHIIGNWVNAKEVKCKLSENL